MKVDTCVWITRQSIRSIFATDFSYRDMLNRLGGSCMFLKIDLRSDYHKSALSREKDYMSEWPWSIQCTHYFPEIDELSFEPFLEKLVAYFDDIFIYSSSEA